MELERITDTIRNLTVGTDLDTPWATLVVAALVSGFVVTVTPKPLRWLAFIYIALMAVEVYMHRMDFVYMGMAGGLVAGLILYPFRPKPKNA